MAKRSKTQSRTLITQLIIVGLILTGVAIFLNSKFETRSKAAFDPEKACTSACRSNERWVKDAGACALDCPNVASGAMSCNAFCSENVNPSGTFGGGGGTSGGGGGGRTGGLGGGAGGDGKTSQSVCRSKCQQWLGDPCTRDGAVCKFAGGKNNALAKSQCSTACNLVKNEEKTCDEAMTQASLSAVMNQLVPGVQQACIKYFE